MIRLTPSFAAKMLLAVAATGAVGASPAQAYVPGVYGSITLTGGQNSVDGANSINLPAINAVSAGPITVDGLTWTVDRGDNPQSTGLFGWTNGYTFGNGTAPAGGDPWIILDGINNSSGYERMRLTFPELTSGFLADYRWTNGSYGSNYSSAIVAAYNDSDQLLGYLYFNNNAGEIGISPGYYGITRPVADIAYIEFDNGSLGAHDLSWVGRVINPTVGGVPEPTSWAMFILGFAALGGRMRARQGMWSAGTFRCQVRAI